MIILKSYKDHSSSYVISQPLAVLFVFRMACGQKIETSA
jgi:hypothetical protein